MNQTVSIDRVLGDAPSEPPRVTTGPRYKPRLRDVSNASRACNRRAVRSRTYDDDVKVPKPKKAKAIPKARAPVAQAPAAGRSRKKNAPQPVAHDGFDNDKDAFTPYISLATVGRNLSDSDSDDCAASVVESVHKTAGGELSDRDYESEAESIRSSCSAYSAIVPRPPVRVRTGSSSVCAAPDKSIALVEDAVDDEW